MVCSTHHVIVPCESSVRAHPSLKESNRFCGYASDVIKTGEGGFPTGETLLCHQLCHFSPSTLSSLPSVISLSLFCCSSPLECRCSWLRVATTLRLHYTNWKRVTTRWSISWLSIICDGYCRRKYLPPFRIVTELRRDKFKRSHFLLRCCAGMHPQC
jgi:hypothetical protein